MKNQRYKRCILLLSLLGVAAPRGVQGFLARRRGDVTTPSKLGTIGFTTLKRPVTKQECPLYASPPKASSSNSVEEEIAKLEQQVLTSAQAQMDYNQITRALLGNSASNDDADDAYQPMPNWQIALTASTMTAALSFVLFSNLYVSLFVLISIFVVANTDPIHENNDNVVGPLARLLGRATLQSARASKPTLQALARAVVTGQDEVRALQLKVQALQDETADLKQWKERRLWVEDNLQEFTVEELKQLARNHEIPVGKSTKLQLLQRLVDSNVIDISEKK